MKTKMMNLMFLNTFLVLLIYNVGSISITEFKTNSFRDSNSIKNYALDNQNFIETNLKLNNNFMSNFILIYNLSIS